jgi:hypothetical protein
MPASLTEGNTMHHPARSLVLLGVAFSLITGTAHAERWLVPAGAHVTGAQDTNWRTDLQVSNPSGVEATITVYLLEAREDNSSLERSSSHTVSANGQIVISDVFEADFSFSGNGGLLVESSNEHLVVTSRTYNLLGADNALELPEGATFGQYIPGVNVDDALSADAEGHIVYLAKSNDFRSNLGFCAATPTGGRATVTMYAEDGTETGSVSRSFNGFEQYQWNDIFSRTGSPDSTAARAVIVADAPIVAYGSVVDERTGDPVAVMAETAENVAFTESAIAAAARVEGLEDTLWRTDIRIFNPGEEAATVTLDYRRKGRSGNPQESTTLTVGAGAILPLDDAMMEAFGLEEANGGIDISSDVAVATWSRTYNQTPSGTFGQSIPAEQTGHPLSEDQARVYNGLTNTGFRSNVGFFNLDSDERTVTLAMVDDTGVVVGSLDYDLQPNEMNQTTDVFGEMGVTTKDSGFYSLLIEFVGDVLSYVSIVDDLSGDPVFQPGELGAFGGAPPTEDCTDIPLPAADTLVFYLITGTDTGTGLAFTGTIEDTYVSTTTTSSVVHTEATLTTPIPISATSDVTTDYSIVTEPAGFVAWERSESTRVPEGQATEERTDTYDPAWLLGPLTRACEGEEWSSGPITQTIRIVGEDATTESYTWEGEVLAVDEPYPASAPSFTAVHWRASRTSGDGEGMSTERWYDVETGVLLHRLDVDTDGTTVLLEQSFIGFGKR